MISAQTIATTPAAGTYQIDPSHSAINLTIRHLAVAKVRGRFTDFTGTIIIGDQPLQSSVNVEIATASIDTGTADRDDHLRSADFFNVTDYPTASFSAATVSEGDGSYRLAGQLSIAGVTNDVELELGYDGEAVDPWGNTRIVFSATTEIDREAFGLTWNQALEAGGVMVGKVAKISIDVEAVKQDPQT